MGNNHSQHPVTFVRAARPLSLHRERSSTVGAELVIGNYALSQRNSTCSQLDWERWQQEQLQNKPILRRTSSQRGYCPRSASLRRLRAVQRRRFLNSSSSKTTAKMEAEKSKLQEEIALLAACARGDLSKVEKLVDSGVDVNSSDQNQMTALHYAAMYTRDNVIKSLISRGAIVDTADLKEGFSAIHWVVTGVVQKCSSTDLLEKSLTALAKAGCSVNATDFTYATPLHIAAQKGNRDAVQVLLRLGADPNKVDITGRDCFEVAQNEQMKTYMKKLFEMPNDQLESKHIYQILEPPLPSIPAPLPTVNPSKLLCTRKSSHEEHIYHTLEFHSTPSSPSGFRASATPPTLLPNRCCQHLQPTTEPHLYHVLEPIPTIKSGSYEPTSPPRKRKNPKH